MDQLERDSIQSLLDEQPADSSLLVEYWSGILQMMYFNGRAHGIELANKEVSHENPLPIPAADNR